MSEIQAQRRHSARNPLSYKTPGPDDEEWRPVVGFEGHYEVSSYGRVRSMARVIVNRVGQQRAIKPLLLRQGREAKTLHRTVKLNSRTRRVHRLVLEAFVGRCPDGMEGCHTDDDAENNHVSNLRWDTHTENMRDRTANGRNPFRLRKRCPRGHRLEEPNLAPWSLLNHGSRMCLACARGHSNVHDARRRQGIALDLKVESDRHYLRIAPAAWLAEDGESE